MQKYLMKLATLVVFAAAAPMAFATPEAAVDVTDVVTSISNQAAPIALVGAAVLSLIVAAKVFKWIRRAM